MSDFYGHLLSRDGLENEGLTPHPQLDQVSAAIVVVDAEGARFLDEGLHTWPLDVFLPTQLRPYVRAGSMPPSKTGIRTNPQDGYLQYYLP